MGGAGGGAPGAAAGLVADGGDHRPGRGTADRTRRGADRRDRHLAGGGHGRGRGVGGVAAVRAEWGAWRGGEAAGAALAARTGELAAAWRQTGACVVAVSDETGLG